MTKVLQLRCSSELLGAERVILELNNSLVDSGFTSIVGVAVEDGEPEPELIKVLKQGGHQTVVFRISGAFDLGAIARIRKYVLENKIDIVHSHGYREDLYAIGCKGKAKLIGTNHLWKRTDWKLKVYAKLDAILLRFFDAVVAVSSPVKKDMLEEGIAERKIRVIQNGIDVAPYVKKYDTSAILTELGVPETKRVFATLSSLTGEKGIDIAIRAFAETNPLVNDYTLLVIGDGPNRADLEALAKELKVDSKVVFCGRRKNVPEILACVDIFILSSYIEGLPMALLEAMASACAIVATAVGDVPEVINDQNGKLVQPGEPMQIATAIAELLSDDKNLQLVSENARATVTERFSSKTMVQQYFESYNALLGTNSNK